MQENSTGRRGKARILAEEYNHSLGKLVGTKTRVKPSRKAAFMAAFPVKASPRLHSVEEGTFVQSPRDASVNHSEHGETSTTEETISNAGVKSPLDVRQKLQIFVRGLVLPKTLCLQLDPETSVSDLKVLVESESGIQPENQHLYIGRNFQLCDLLSIRDHGIQQDQNIELRAGGLLGGGPLGEEQSRNTYFLKLASGLGPHWEKLAFTLGFSVSVVDTFRANYPGNVEQQSFRMLDAWWRKQDNPAAPEKLREALKAIGRVDLALQLPGIGGASFDVTQCARELAAHYRETMKVTTHPTERHMSIAMDDIYVKPLLLQETNLPTPASSSETKMQAETGSQSEHSKASKRGTPESLRSKPDMDEGKHVQKVPLDSYEDMLKLKGNRLLITAESGFGKTTLCKKIAYDWADLKTKGGQTENQQQPEPTSVLERYELVFVVEVNRMGEKFDIIDAIFSQIITDRKLKNKYKDLGKYIHDNPERVLILLDGSDDISMQRLKDEHCENEIDLNGVLSFKSLKSCKVMVTSRQKTAHDLLNMHAHYTKINIAGFNEKDREIYVRKYLRGFEPDNQETFLEKVNGSATLRSAAEIPLFLQQMCRTWAHEGKLPNHITSLFREKASMVTDDQVSDTKVQGPVSQLGRIALEGLLDQNGEKVNFMKDKIDPKDLETFERGIKDGLLSFQRLKTGSQYSFPHKTFQEYHAAVFLEQLSRTDREAFDQYLSRIFHGDVESLEYVLRFCCGLNTNAAEMILRRIGDFLKPNELNTSLHRISMLLLLEAQSEYLITEFVKTGKIEFPYELQGEVLVAAHYFFQIGSKHRTLHNVDIQNISASCRGLADLRLLEDIMTRMQCKPSLNLVLHGISWNSFVDSSTEMLKYLESLEVYNCNWNLFKLVQVLSNTKTQEVRIRGTMSLDKLSEQNIRPVPSLKNWFFFDCGLTQNDIEPLFSLLSVAGSVKTLALVGSISHGLQQIKIQSVPSLKELLLIQNGLTKDDIEPLFSLLSSAGSIKRVILQGNELHGLQPVEIGSVCSLKQLQLAECGLTNTDIEPLFSLLSSAGNIQQLTLRGNNLHGLQPHTIAGALSLKELQLLESALTNSDIEPLFSLLSAAGSVTKVVMKGNNFHGLQPFPIARVPSLEELHLCECGLRNNDMWSFFSLLSLAGNIQTVVLRGNNLHGLPSVMIDDIPSLKELQLLECGLTKNDIGPLFSLLSSAGSIKKVVLRGNDLNGLQPIAVASVPSLENFQLRKCNLTKSDIEPLFSLLLSAGNIKSVVLSENNLHGLQTVTVPTISSLEELQLLHCCLTSTDIKPLFSVLSSAGSIRTVVLEGNNFNDLQPFAVASVPSLAHFEVYTSGLTNSDIEPLFSILSCAPNIKTVFLRGNNLHGLHPVTNVPPLQSFGLYDSGLTSSDMESILSLLSSAGTIKTVVLKGNNLHGLQPITMAGVSSLKELQLIESGLTNSDIEPLFSALSSAGSIKKVVLQGNNLHGLWPITIAGVSSLKELELIESGLTNSDIEPLFSFLLSVGSIEAIALKGNNLHGLKPVTISSVPSLEEVNLLESGLANSDIGPLFSLLSAAGSVKTLCLQGNNLHGLEPVPIDSVPSLEALALLESGLTNRDIKPLFSLLSSAGNIQTVILKGNNLHGMQADAVASVPSLKELHLHKSGLSKDDIKPLFSLFASAGFLEVCVLKDNNLHGLQPDAIASVPSLKELQLLESCLTNSDIIPLFSLLSSSGSIKTVALRGINWHGLQPVTIASVPSLEALHLYQSGLTNSDVKSLFSLLSSVGSIKTVVLAGNNLHGLQPIATPSVPSLEYVRLAESGLTKSDIEPLFSLLTSAGSIKQVVLQGNNFHGLPQVNIDYLSSLDTLHLSENGLRNSDIGSVFHLLSSLGCITEVDLSGNNLHGVVTQPLAPVPTLKLLILGHEGVSFIERIGDINFREKKTFVFL